MEQYCSQLFEDWIKLSTEYIAIQWIGGNKTNHAIRWIVIYPLDADSGINLSNNPGRFSLVLIS